MNWSLFSQLLVTALVAFAGAWLAHWLASRRDHKNARRDKKTEFLIGAYRELEFAADRESLKDSSLIEKAIADIQLFGSRRQVALAQQFASEFCSSGSASLNTVLQELRRDLRAELELEEVPDRLIFFRCALGGGQQKSDQSSRLTSVSRRS